MDWGAPKAGKSTVLSLDGLPIRLAAGDLAIVLVAREPKGGPNGRGITRLDFGAGSY